MIKQQNLENFNFKSFYLVNLIKFKNKMQAIRQIIEVENHTFSVVLPDDFTASRVEVIILASNPENDIPEWQQTESERRYEEYLKNPEIALSHKDFIKKLDAL